MSIDAADNTDLIGILASNLKGEITVHFGDVQIPLELEEDEEPHPQAELAHMTADNGDAILPHKFTAAADDEAKCTYCQAGESADIHDVSRIPPESENGAQEQAEAEASLKTRSRSTR